MFNDASNSALVMVGSPYHPNTHQHYSGNPCKSIPADAYPQLNSYHAGGPPHEYYLHQQPRIEIIELIEVPPPTRREHISVPDSSSSGSDSYASSSSEEESSAVESYCSSEDHDEVYRSSSAEETKPMRGDNSFQARMRRIEQWRNAYAKAVGAELAPSPSRIKRKCGSNDDDDDDDDDTFSRSSKRSRQGSMSGSASTSTSASARSVHSCSACDASFPDRNSLHKHGFNPRTNDACRAAVEYDIEQ
ncbi:hypothetical protein EW145_g1112 [Phellinidium pouzarii]|uniref:Uncharacterized protein n=1 Tax=Phellinidium pouzarii TaxID=167371 RepID=A0A4S4LFR9_9AGAM|nr:hypothetical protein EW145_g1112 [Phellinidium pouzarii]